MKNVEIEFALNGMNDNKSVFKTGVFSYKTRQDLRLLRKRLLDVYEVYAELRNELFRSFADAGKADKESGGIITVKKEYAAEIAKELQQLGNVDNDIDLLTESAASEIIKLDMSMQDDDILRLISRMPDSEGAA